LRPTCASRERSWEGRVVAVSHGSLWGLGGGSRLISKDGRTASLRRYVAIRRVIRQFVHGTAILGVLGLVVWSAILAKEAKSAPVLAAVETTTLENGGMVTEAAYFAPFVERGIAEMAEADPTPELPTVADQSPKSVAKADSKMARLLADPSVRFFDGRPVRPAKKMWMTVTGYSPDERSCPGTADNLTSTLHHVTTNGFKLVAADPRVLAYGSMLTIEGYDNGQIVPVLDCGGAIKGRRLDLLFPTHEEARKWGRKRILVTVWEYADGKPAGNVRKAR